MTQNHTDRQSLTVLSFPPPFTGMVAINSDIEFTTWQSQLDLFDMFAELGLETACSFWCFGDGEQTWRLFEEDDSLSPQAKAAFIFARAGMLDTLHSFGGVVHGKGTIIHRNRIERAYQVLRQEGVRVLLYSNHGTEQDKQNIGGDWATYQEGDVPGSGFYHLDLTLDYGIKFFWTDIDYDNDWTVDETAGQSQSEWKVLTTQQCRDERTILRFRRYRGHLQYSPYAHNLAEQLSPMLQRGLVGYRVIYQHLGVHRDENGKPYSGKWPLFRESDLETLRQLAFLDTSGKVIVTTTKRLLVHALLMESKCWTMTGNHEGWKIFFPEQIHWKGVKFPLSWDDLQGWCVELPGDEHIEVRLGSEVRPLKSWMRGGKWYAGFSWSRIDSKSCLDEVKTIEGACHGR